MSVPAEYIPINKNNNDYVGTDLYLASGAAIWTALMMNFFITTVGYVYNFPFNQNVVYVVMAIPALLSAYNVLNSPQTSPRRRISNAIYNSLNLVFFTLITVPCQIAQSMTSGIYITRNIFE